MMIKYSVVIISHEVPKPEPTSAGERLIRELYFTLKDIGHTPIFLAPVPRNGFAPAYDVPAHFVEVGQGPIERLINRATLPVATWVPNIRLYMALLRDKSALEILRQARIIDMQWSANVLLAPLLRKINPYAKLVGTFHDINEQRLKRRAITEPHGAKAALWRFQGVLAGKADSVALRSLDKAVVLSEKDRALLTAPLTIKDKVYTVIPPVYIEMNQKSERQPDLNHLVFIGTMYRWENHQAVEWFIQDVLPIIWKENSKIRLTVVGESPSPELVELGNDSRITFTGFVENLEPIYAEASLIIAPIHLGSGVKFKTLEAILRGIPVVSTGAGVEGIAKVDWVSAIAQTPESFARSVRNVLSNYDSYTEKAKKSSLEAQRVYSKNTYQMLIKEVYEK